MPNNSGTVIVGGHGSYNKNVIFDASAYNYNIVFPCAMKMSITNTTHNHLMYGIYSLGNQPYLNVLEGFPSTYKANNTAPIVAEYDMSLKHSRLLFQHNISSADNVVDFLNLSQMPGSNYTGITCANARAWGVNNNNATIGIYYNPTKLAQQILNNHPQNPTNYTLLADDYIFITPVSPQNVVFSMSMNFLFTEVLPHIKFPIKYTPGNQLNNINPTAIALDPFIDDNLSLQNKTNAYQGHFLQNEIYNEVSIAGDSNIIWDACRVEV